MVKSVITGTKMCWQLVRTLPPRELQPHQSESKGKRKRAYANELGEDEPPLSLRKIPRRMATKSRVAKKSSVVIQSSLTTRSRVATKSIEAIQSSVATRSRVAKKSSVATRSSVTTRSSMAKR